MTHILLTSFWVSVIALAGWAIILSWHDASR